MALPAFASEFDLTDRMGGSCGDAGLAALDAASALIRAEAGKTWVTDGVLDEDVPDILRVVCVSVALRATMNPEGRASMSASVIGFQESTSFAHASPDVYLTKAERRQVRRAAGRGVLGSIALESPWT